MGTTGIDKLKNETPREALIFENYTCPHCGSNLYIETRYIKSNEIKIRYRCDNCDFICPILYKNENLIPVYDDSIYKFIQDFGIIDRYKFIRRWETIRNERRTKSNRTSIQNKKSKK